MTRKRWIIALIVLVLLACGALVFLRPQQQAKKNFLVEDVKKGDMTLAVSASGKVVPHSSQNVTAQNSRKIGIVYVQTGESVTKGQLLAEQESSDLMDALDKAQKAYNSALVARKNAKALYPPNPLAVQMAQAQVDAASKNLDNMHKALDTIKLTAPFDGEVTAAFVKVGDFLATGQPAFTVQSVNDLEATISVNEVDVTNVKIGQEVSLEIDAVRETRKGTIYIIVDTGEAPTNGGVVTYLTKIHIADTSKLRPGMTINAEIDVDSRKNILLVSSGAIHTRDGKSYVNVITDEKTQTTEEREVTIGLNNNSVAEVLSGLKEGEKVAITLENK